MKHAPPAEILTRLGKNNGVGNHELGVRLALEVLEAVDRLLSHAELGLVPMSAIAAMGKDIKRRVCMLDAQRRGRRVPRRAAVSLAAPGRFGCTKLRAE